MKAGAAHLYASASVGDVLVAETTYTVPPPVTATPPPAPLDYDCEDFQYQEEAQVYLRSGDPHGLDADNDGVACDDLPLRAFEVTPTLRLGEAALAGHRHLRKRYASFRRGAGRRVSCSRSSRLSVRCGFRWSYDGRRYRATVRVRALDAQTLSVRSSVRRLARASVGASASRVLALVSR